MAEPSRIKQGVDGTDKLYTVRPRNVASVTDKRGTASSIRFKLPGTAGEDLSKYTASKNLTSAELSALTDATNSVSGNLGFINFIAQSVNYSIQEKSQIMHTFGGGEAVYFYGRAPVMVQLSGIITDDIDNDQFAKFLGLYNKFLRGSEAAKEYAYVTLSLNNAVFNGTFMNISIQQDSARDTDITFSAQFLAKSFTLASADTVFGETVGDTTSYLKVRDVDPTLTREGINAIIQANQAAASLTAEEDKVNTTDVNAFQNEPLLGSWSSLFGSLPTLSEDVISAATISSFFDGASGGLSELLNPLSNLLGSASGFARDMIGITDAVENGLNDILGEIDSISNQVYGTIENFDEAITKITNFPASLSAKLSVAGNPGGSSVDAVGSDSISSSDAAALLSATSGVGSSRGTPSGAAASLSLRASSNQGASLFASSGGDDTFTVTQPVSISQGSDTGQSTLTSLPISLGG